MPSIPYLSNSPICLCKATMFTNYKPLIMKKSMPLLQAAAVCMIVIVLLFGCNKIDSTAALDHQTKSRSLSEVQHMVYSTPNRLEVQWFRGQGLKRPARSVRMAALAAAAHGNNDTAIFTYNTLGNPVSISHQKGIGDNIFFKYDNTNRLTDFIIAVFVCRAAQTGGDQSGIRYLYDPHNTTRVIADTTYIEFLSDHGKITSYELTELTTFVYDAQSRISQTTKTVLADDIDDTTVTAYNYDSHGNLEASGAVYDNKINVHRTNKLWMFLDKDYSVNNQVDNGTYTYNQGNLPLTIATSSLELQVAAFYFMVVGYPNAISLNVTIVSYLALPLNITANSII